MDTLDRNTLGTELTRPGITVVGWLAAHGDESRLLDRVLRSVAARRSDARLAVVDADPALAGDYGVDGLPAVTAYRDGTLVFVMVGVLPPGVIDSLIDAAMALDGDLLRRGGNGGGARLVLALRPGDQRVVQGSPDEGSGGAPRGGPQ